jgi:hypothetical protein
MNLRKKTDWRAVARGKENEKKKNVRKKQTGEQWREEKKMRKK